MTTLKIQPAKRIQGRIRVPGDKSISHRAIMLGSLAYGTTRVENFLDSADCLSTAEIFRSLGTRIQRAGTRVVIQGRGLQGLAAPKRTLDAGNSGTTSRILLGLLAGQPFESRLTGDKYLRKRPMRRVTEPVSRMGAQFIGKEQGSFLPIRVKGGALKGIQYELPVASAQVKSAILLAGLYAQGVTSVTEPLPTRDHTERMFAAFGIPLKRRGKTVSLRGPVQPFKGRNIRVPGDISSAAFFLVAGLLVPGSELTIEGVGVNPTRTGLLEVLLKMGADMSVTPRKVGKGEEPVADLTVRASKLKAVQVWGATVPKMVDEFPILAVAATQAQGTTVVRNAEDLRVKESNRIEAVTAFLTRMGANISSTPDGWIIKGPTPLMGVSVDSHGDHRIAMSAAIAALVAKGPTVIRDVDNIETSFPGFEKLLGKVVRR